MSVIKRENFLLQEYSVGTNAPALQKYNLLRFGQILGTGGGSMENNTQQATKLLEEIREIFRWSDKEVHIILNSGKN